MRLANGYDFVFAGTAEGLVQIEKKVSVIGRWNGYRIESLSVRKEQWGDCAVIIQQAIADIKGIACRSAVIHEIEEIGLVIISVRAEVSGKQLELWRTALIRLNAYNGFLVIVVTGSDTGSARIAVNDKCMTAAFRWMACIKDRTSALKL